MPTLDGVTVADRSISYTYRYAAPSACVVSGATTTLSLAASGGEVTSSVLFSGALSAPSLVGSLLLATARVAEARFYVPRAMMAAILRRADPVVTADGEGLRFESFSACGGVYARADILADALQPEAMARGTTNVEFNARMRGLLSRLGNDSNLVVAEDALSLHADGASAVERKVDLPLRWVNGFAEVQVAQRALRDEFEIRPELFRRFVRSLPATASRRAALAVSILNGGVRLSHAGARAADVAVGGPERLRGFDDLAANASALKLYGGDAASAWEFDYGVARFVLVLSPDAARGFSGEGNALDAAADRGGAALAEAIAPWLTWDRRVDEDRLAVVAGLDRASVDRGLARLGAEGAVGFDLHEGHYFHRPLPFAPRAMDTRLPRLRDAQRLVDAKAVFLFPWTQPDVMEALVNSGGVEHRVRIDPDGGRCTCPWFARYARKRGPCKHQLAVRLLAQHPHD